LLDFLFILATVTRSLILRNPSQQNLL